MTIHLYDIRNTHKALQEMSFVKWQTLQLSDVNMVVIIQLLKGKHMKIIDSDFHTKIDAYIEENWDACLADITSLVKIPSVEDLDKAETGAPFGPGPRAALTEALSIAKRMGFATTDVEGYAGFAELPGAHETQLGIIGHVDVVPDGPGWHFPPYNVTEKDGYLIGRGTLDDKGPLMVCLYALKFWKDQGKQLPYTFRFIFGANEETDLMDVEHYRKTYTDPEFLFTPDAEFPVCYGEKGGFNANITSKPITDGVIAEFTGGAATNAVPGEAIALVHANADELPASDGITVTCENDTCARIHAQGKSAHASTPESGKSAIAMLVNYLLENNLCNEVEREFLETDKKLLDHTDGSGVGIATHDDYFGPLTVVGGTIKMDNNRFIQTLDSRFPTSTDGDKLLAQLRKVFEPIGATVENTMLLPPFLTDPNSPEIQALSEAFNTITGEDRKPFTIGGGTYAREFKRGASFGVEMPWIENPDWVGSMHGPDEGISIQQLKTAWKIYALAFGKLCELDL